MYVSRLKYHTSNFGVGNSSQTRAKRNLVKNLLSKIELTLQVYGRVNCAIQSTEISDLLKLSKANP